MINKKVVSIFSVVGLLLSTSCGQKGELYLKNSSDVAENDKFLLQKTKTQSNQAETNPEIDQVLQKNIKKMKNNPNDY
ncbi:MAG: hypothetical protein KGV51_06090 [Moraxellaceae bacterium]|nr:hypothetical protein [Moraxellaceae bacterium]